VDKTNQAWTSPLTVDMTNQTWTSPLTVDMTDPSVNCGHD